jgi:hypothetical protein
VLVIAFSRSRTWLTTILNLTNVSLMKRSRAIKLGNAIQKHRTSFVRTRDYRLLFPLILAQMFPDSAVGVQAKGILERYGSSPDEPEPERVRIAILKLAGADLAAIEDCVEASKEDYEDTLLHAETPKQFRASFHSLKPHGEARIIAEDRQQYDEWLRTHSVD